MKKSSSKSKSNAKAKTASKAAKRSSSRKGGKSNASGKSRSESTDVIALILKDHKPIKELIEILKDEEVSFAKKQPAFVEFELALTSHAKAEEESLYVHLKEIDHLVVEGLEGDIEHALADQLMREINDSNGDEDTWMAKVKVLAELVEHHVKEEEKEVFKKVRKDFNTEQRNEIGEMYARLHSEYQENAPENRKYTDRDDLRVQYV